MRFRERRRTWQGQSPPHPDSARVMGPWITSSCGARYTERVSVPLVAVGPGELDLQGLMAEVAASGSGDGAVATFSGLVRDHNQGRRVDFLIYEAYEALAIRTLARIVDEARQEWPDTRLGVHHRIGRLEIGEASI